MGKEPSKKQHEYEMRDEYDLSKMTMLPRGRFDPKNGTGKNVAVLDPDIAKGFPGDEAVNPEKRLKH